MKNDEALKIIQKENSNITKINSDELNQAFQKAYEALETQIEMNFKIDETNKKDIKISWDGEFVEITRKGEWCKIKPDNFEITVTIKNTN